MLVLFAVNTENQVEIAFREIGGLEIISMAKNLSHHRRLADVFNCRMFIEWIIHVLLLANSFCASSRCHPGVFPLPESSSDHNTPSTLARSLPATSLRAATSSSVAKPTMRTTSSPQRSRIAS